MTEQQGSGDPMEPQQDQRQTIRDLVHVQQPADIFAGPRHDLMIGEHTNKPPEKRKDELNE